MSWRTVIALFWLIFNSLWLCHVFIVLALGSDYLITEPNQWLAGFEALLTFALAMLGIERLVKLREYK